MRVNHRRRDVGMAEQILHGSNVATAAEQGRRERVAEGVAVGGLRDARLFYGTFEGAPERSGHTCDGDARHRPWIGRMRAAQNPEPRPGMPGARIPAHMRRKRNAAAALGLVLQPPCPCIATAARAGWAAFRVQHQGPILEPFCPPAR